ncbi:MAG: hypothetical protein M1835_004913, partial [Candelina submexicana]
MDPTFSPENFTDVLISSSERDIASDEGRRLKDREHQVQLSVGGSQGVKHGVGAGEY